MFKRMVGAVVAATLVVLVPAPSVAQVDRPSTVGTWMVDATGRALVLHGVNMVNKLGSYAPDATGFGDDDAAFLAANGLDAVRLGVIWKAVEPAPGQYDDAYLARIKATIETLHRHGIGTMIDFHQDMFNERFEGEGAPDWAVDDDGLPAEPKLGFNKNYLAMLALNRAYDNFWANKKGPGGVGVQDRYAAAWKHVAKYFAATPGVMSFDLFNEPWPGTAYALCAVPLLGCPVQDALLTKFSQRVIDQIRTVDKRTVTFYEPYALFNNGIATNVAPKGSSLGFSFHAYCLSSTFTGRGLLGNYGLDCAVMDGLVFANAKSHIKKRQVVPLLTEFGGTPNVDINMALVDHAAKHQIGWMYWAYCGCNDPTGAKPADHQAIVYDPAAPPTGANVATEVLRSIAIPHPQAVAGTPGAYRFDRTDKSFTFAYTTQKLAGGRFGNGARTTIATPVIQYPTGYTVKVTGARVVSAPNASTLVLAQSGAATRIVVTVQAR